MKVLVAIDNKPSSQAILDALVKMRWYEGTEIELLTVLPPGQEYGTGQQNSMAAEEVEGLVVELLKTLGHCEVRFFAKHGDPQNVIIEMADQQKSDLIVLGSNCKNTLERLLIGSVCQSVLNGASCPVIIAKTPCSLAREASPAFKTVLLPIDHSIFSDAAIKWLANFSWAPDTRFIIAAVVSHDTDMSEVEQSMQKRATDLSRLLSTQNILLEVATGEPRDCILELSKKYYSDLIVMGSHGHTGLRKLILGSVSQSVSEKAPCAVAIVRGIVADDEKWLKTGAFSKLRMEVPEVVGSRSEEGRVDISAHVMPGGM